jgi:ankyrin repeat protein
MKNTMLPIITLVTLGTLAQAADPADAQWEKMFEVMHDLPKSPKDSQLERLKLLIDQGADVNAAIGFDRMLREGETRADLRGTTWPLDVAVQQARVDMVKLLLVKGAKFHGGELAQAALAGNQDESLAMITALLQAGADVNSRRLFQGGCAAHDYGFTALFWAGYKGNKNSVKLLLAQPGIKLDETSDEGDTALMAAAEHGHADIVEMLLKAGANVSITDKAGETAITRAQKTLVKQQAIIEKQQAIISKLQYPPK